MSIFRNREVLILTLLGGAITLVGLLAALHWVPQAFWLVGGTALLLNLLFGWFTLWRYRQLQLLTQYLARINSGQFSLDLRDNDEGELSILKSEIYKVTVMLQEQAETLKEEKLQLASALSDISHQLKTPLTSMFVMTDILIDSQLSPERRQEFTSKIRSQLERLQWLVSSLLKLSKLDAGTVQFKKQPVNAEAILDRALEPLLIPLELKELQLNVECPPQQNIVCDFNWTCEALVNVLKNCVEHTPPGGTIFVSIRENPLYQEILIQDTGPGIPREELPFIFNRFFRGKNAGEDSLGIGLAMARTIITAQGGGIDVKSIPGSGTNFSLKFYR